MKKLPKIIFLSALPVFLLGLAVFPMFLPELAEVLELKLNESSVRLGIIRFFSGHFTHFDNIHFGYDAAAFLLLSVLIRMKNQTCYLAFLLLSCVCVSGSVFLFCKGLSVYRGLSGIDSGLFVLAVLLYWKELPKLTVIPVLCGFLGKTLWELYCGSAVFVHGNTFEVVPAAHLAGGAAGLLYGLFIRRFSTRRQKRTERLDRFVEKTHGCGHGSIT